jgi:RNA polymerase sigma factor (TIGR02999 family)
MQPVSDTPPSREEPAAIGAITRHLIDWRAGDSTALSRLTEELYTELRRMAGAVIHSGVHSGSLQPTELVHELYFRLRPLHAIDWQGRAHFLNLTAQMMRRILVDYSRKLHAAKRGGPLLTVELESGAHDPALELDVLLVHGALERLSTLHPRQAHVLELRFFGGLTAAETAEVLTASGADASVRTVERDWTFAKAWMQNALRPA